MPEPKDFQRISSKKIFSELKTTTRIQKRRYLLADEVGLGKTYVAQNVISEFYNMEKKRKTKDDIRIVYFTCNLEIAGQNHIKLFPNNVGTPHDKTKLKKVNRLTLFPFSDIGNSYDDLKIFSFTPGTSLDLGRASGTIEERKYLFHLLLVYLWEHLKIKDKGISRNKIGKFLKILLKATAKSSWDKFIKERGKCLDINKDLIINKVLKFGKTSKNRSFLNQLYSSWDKDLCEEKKKAEYWQHIKDICKYNYNTKVSNKSRNKIIGKMRELLALEAIKVIDPTLIIMDEFQKFDDLLYNDFSYGDEHDKKYNILSNKKQKIVNPLVKALLGDDEKPAKYPLLLLSATPYKYLDDSYGIKLRRKNVKDMKRTHQKSFFSMIKMLSNNYRGKNAPEDKLKELFSEYKECFKNAAVAESIRKEHIYKIIEKKMNIETIMHKYICRTERYAYETEDNIKDFEMHEWFNEKMNEKQFEQSHFEELFKLERLRILLKENNLDVIQRIPLNYWKSGNYLLSFCGDYKWLENLFDKKTKNKIKKKSLLKKKVNDIINSLSFENSAGNNLKLKYLSDKLNNVRECLWVLPSVIDPERDITEKKNPFKNSPDKFLIFSNWRFVPRMLSCVISKHNQVPVPKDIRPAIKSVERIKLFIPEELLNKGEDWFNEIGKVWFNEMLDKSIKSGGKNKQESDNEGDKKNLKEQTLSTLEKLNNNAPSVKIRKNYPGNAIHSAIMKYIYNPESTNITKEYLTKKIFECSFGSFRRYFTNEYRVSVIESVFNNKSDKKMRYAEKLEKYLEYGFFAELIDEFVYILKNEFYEDNTDSIDTIFEYIEDALNINAGGPNYQSGLKLSKKVTARISMDFLSKSSGHEKASERRQNIRRAFNSPFQPFVLSTTSIGQEGLDFHYYCRDVVHWDLPSNPEDMEQREGRIRRYMGRAVRQRIANDYISYKGIDHSGLDWNKATDEIDTLSYSIKKSGKLNYKNYDFFKKGLYPGWIYTSKKSSTINIRRHIMCYPFSNDIERYKKLKKELKLYRFVLGQNKQNEIIGDAKRIIDRYCPKILTEEQVYVLSINLAPSDYKNYKKYAKINAKDKIIKCDNEIKALLEFARFKLAENRTSIKEISNSAHNKIKKLIDFLSKNIDSAKNYLDLYAFLYYFVSPYDEKNDALLAKGFEDDMRYLGEIDIDKIILRSKPVDTQS